MELDHVDAVATAVVRTQARAITMGVERQPVQRIAGQCAVGVEPPLEPRPALAGDRLSQRHVVGPQVPWREWGGWLSTVWVANGGSGSINYSSVDASRFQAPPATVNTLNPGRRAYG